MNIGFFAPRLTASRLKILAAPLVYIKSPAVVRQQAIKTYLSFLGAGGATLAAAKLMGAEVGTDPYSADFGKIKIGNTRIDVWGGEQQFVRTAFQFVAGKTVSSSTGKTTRVGEGYKPLTRWEILTRLAESKLAPLPGLFMDFMKGRTYTGEKFSLGKELAQNLIPIYSSLWVQDFLDIVKDDPEHVWMAIPGFFGLGIQTYQAPKKMKLY
jgi:hypothetical protein